MGLFALPLGNTAKINVEEAVTNLNIYLENYSEEDPAKLSYLLYFAKSCIEAAENKIDKKEGTLK